MVHLVAIDERDHVGVLFDRARLAQIGEQRAAVGAGLDLAVELRERDHRDAEFLGQRLERARDLGDLLFARFARPRRAHQLQIVDDDQPQVGAGIAREPPAFRLQHDRGRVRAVVDKDRRLGQPRRRHRELGKIALAEVPGARLRAIDSRLRAQQPQHELLLGHFQREEGDAAARLGFGRRVRRDVERERRLAHRGARGDHDQVGRLQARGDAVEVGEAGRHPGHHLLALVEPLDDFERLARQLVHRVERGADAALGDFEDFVLGLVEELVDARGRVVGGGGDFGRGRGERAQYRLLAHDARVVGDVGGGRDAGGELGDVSRAADRFELAARAQRVGHRDGVDRLVAVRQLGHHAKDLAMRLAIEVVGVEDFEGLVDGLVLEQDRAEHRLLGLQILRRNAP